MTNRGTFKRNAPDLLRPAPSPVRREVREQCKAARGHICYLSNEGIDDSHGLVDESDGLVDESNGLVDESDGLVDESNGLVDESDGLVDESNGLVDESDGLVDESRGLVDECRGLVDESRGLNGAIGLGAALRASPLLASASRSSTRIPI